VTPYGKPCRLLSQLHDGLFQQGIAVVCSNFLDEGVAVDYSRLCFELQAASPSSELCKKYKS